MCVGVIECVMCGGMTVGVQWISVFNYLRGGMTVGVTRQASDESLLLALCIYKIYLHHKLTPVTPDNTVHIADYSEGQTEGCSLSGDV